VNTEIINCLRNIVGKTVVPQFRTGIVSVGPFFLQNEEQSCNAHLLAEMHVCLSCTVRVRLITNFVFLLRRQTNTTVFGSREIFVFLWHQRCNYVRQRPSRTILYRSVLMLHRMEADCYWRCRLLYYFIRYIQWWDSEQVPSLHRWTH